MGTSTWPPPPSCTGIPPSSTGSSRCSSTPAERHRRRRAIVLGPRSVRAPDVTRFRQGIVPDTERSQFPVADVDLVVEVISPESDERDQLIKPHEYAQAGIPEFWLVDRDPDDRRSGAVVRVFRLTPGPSGEVYTLIRRSRLSELEGAE